MLRKTVKKTTKKAVKKTSTVKAKTQQIVSYKILSEMTRNIEDLVNYHISKGWSPVGGVVLKDNTFVQTMVLLPKK